MGSMTVVRTKVPYCTKLAGEPHWGPLYGVIRAVIDACERGLFVLPGDAPALAQAILTLASDPARGRAMGQRARNYVALHFNRADHAHQFSQLLTRLSN
jgi:glycosyltransferase involved in cell wall biosynthesis